MRSRPGSAPSSSTYGRAGGGAITVSPTPGPCTASSSRAVSRTERLTQSSTLRPLSVRNGPSVIRPCDGFSPTSPQHDAGMRIEPPPSVAWAIGTMPDRDRGRRAAARPARARARCSTGCASARRRGLGHGHAAQLRAVRPAERDETRRHGSAPRASCRPARSAAPPQGAVAVRHRLPGVVGGQILQQERHAAERTVGQVAAVGDLAGVVEPADDHGVERTVEPLDALDRRLGQLDRFRVAALHELGLGGGVEPLGLVGERGHAESPSTTHSAAPPSASSADRCLRRRALARVR